MGFFFFFKLTAFIENQFLLFSAKMYEKPSAETQTSHLWLLLFIIRFHTALKEHKNYYFEGYYKEIFKQHKNVLVATNLYSSFSSKYLSPLQIAQDGWSS